MQSLFPDAYVRGIRSLRILARRVEPRIEPGEHLSRRAGTGMEFRDHRAYAPGDDLRRVDWNVYRRTRRLYLRLAEEPRELPVHVLLDCSASMFFEQPPRIDAGRQVAAALVAAAAHQHDRVAVYPLGHAELRPIRLAGPHGLARMLDELTGLRAKGTIELARSISQFARQQPSRGLTAVVSDFFEPQGLQPLLEVMAGLRQRLVLVQLARAIDRDPGLNGDIELIDCETGTGVRTSITPEELRCYREAYEAFDTALRAFAGRRGAPFLRIDCDQPILPQLSRLFVGGVLRV